MSYLEGQNFSDALQELNDSIPDEETLERDETESETEESQDTGEETVETTEPETPVEVISTPQETTSPPSAFTLTAEQQQQWEIYQGIDNRLRTDPDFAQRFREAFVETEVETPDTQFELDPAVQAYIDQRLSQIQPLVQEHQQVIAVQQARENDAAIARAKTAYAAEHALDDVAMERVYKEGEKYATMLGPLLSGGMDKETALGKVFDVALMQLDDLRQAEVSRLINTSKKDQQRKAKAGSLSGSSGSVPRTPTKIPETRHDRQQAMIRELAESLNVE